MSTTKITRYDKELVAEQLADDVKATLADRYSGKSLYDLNIGQLIDDVTLQAVELVELKKDVYVLTNRRMMLSVEMVECPKCGHTNMAEDGMRLARQTRGELQEPSNE